MPVSIVVGGQFGSEGKGKVALELVRRSKSPVTAIRVGGPNSGHTAYSRSGTKWALRQMPASSIDGNVDVIFPPGSYIDVDLLLQEIESLQYDRSRIKVSEFARIITQDHVAWEAQGKLSLDIGSTGSGVGAAVLAAAARHSRNFALLSPQARDDGRLSQFIEDTTYILRKKLERNERVVVEGTQGFGLSLLDGGFWPKATARVTTAAGALAESGLSPLDVDDVTMVIRSFPIRVAGDSGPLPNETTWEAVSSEAGRKDDIREYTTVTKKLRRVGYFDPVLVRRALAANSPSRIVLNHLDYVDALLDNKMSERASRFVLSIEKSINQKIDWLGVDAYGVIENWAFT